MPGQSAELTDQARTEVGILNGLFRGSLLAVYLHGSAVSGGLRPQSDIDVLAIIDSPMAKAQRLRLLSALLKASTPHPAPPGDLRCIEVMVFLGAEASSSNYPSTAEFIYGEWLRTSYDSGELPMPVTDSGNTLALAQLRQHSRPLLGSSATEILPEVPAALVRRAMRDALPALLQGLLGDERNVLLTLARMWRTGATGEFAPKDAAATWAEARMPERDAKPLTLAREAYLGNLEDTWEERRVAVLHTADYLRQRVLEHV
jgi:streptomycin 3"-adenylyltransferase